MQRLPRVIGWAGVVFALGSGVWAFAAPRSFYDNIATAAVPLTAGWTSGLVRRSASRPRERPYRRRSRSDGGWRGLSRPAR
jgi:hypothetical protein